MGLVSGDPFTAESFLLFMVCHILFAAKLIWSKYTKLKLFSTRSNVENCFGYFFASAQEAG